MLDDFEFLVGHLQDPEPGKRLYALRELVKERHLAAVPAQVFLTLFRTDADLEIRNTALEGLALLGERTPLQPLLELLTDPAYDDWKQRIIEVLGRLGEKAPLDLLVRLVQDATSEPGVRESALESLVVLKDRVPFAVFLRALTDEEPALRAVVARAVAVGEFRVPAPLLIECLSDADGEVRKEAVKALTTYGAEAPIEPLVAMLRDPEPQVREKAALATDVLIEWFGTQVPLDDLVGLVQDPIFYVRETALDVLANHPHLVPVEPFAQALSDENLYVRLAAIEGLVKMGRRVSSDYQSAVQQALHDSDPRVRHRAAFVLLALAGLADPDNPPQPGMHVTEIG